MSKRKYLRVSLNEDVGYFTLDMNLLCDELRQFWENDPRPGESICFDVVELTDEAVKTAPDFQGW